MRRMVKMDIGAVVKLLTGQGKPRRYIGGMPTFPLAGVSYEYLRPALKASPTAVHSWKYGEWPKVEAHVPLTGGKAVAVYGEAMRWTAEQILVRWRDDEGHYHDAWMPASSVRKLTASEWDIVAFHACPPELRSVRWRNRLPGFLPE